MGLDIYVFRARKISDDEAKMISGLNVNDIENFGYTIFNGANSDSFYVDLKPFLTEVEAFSRRWDMEKIATAAGFKSKCYIICQSYNDGFTLLLKSKRSKHERSLVIPKNEIVFYTKAVPMKALVVDLREVAYWRKAYNLADTMHECYTGTIENCGFYSVNDDMLNAIKGTGQLTEIGSAGEDNLFYHEWY